MHVRNDGCRLWVGFALTDDTLIICLDPRPDAAAPADLETQQGDGRLLITLRRAKKQ